MLTKTSILAFFLSLAHDQPLFKWCNWLTLAVVSIAGIALTLLNIFQCKPISAGFVYPTPQNANCTDIVTLYLSSAPVNIITDLAILVLPMPTLTSMRLPKKQKIILVVTFSFGLFVTVVDIVRIAYLENAALSRLRLIGTKGGNSRIVEENDFPWYASLSFMWSAVEVNVGIVCACVPSLKPLFSRFLPGFIRDTGDVSLRGGSFDQKLPEESPGLDEKLNMLTNPAAFKTPSNAEYRGGPDEDDMGFLDFLSGPIENGAALGRTSTALTRAQTNKSTKTATDFDFVHMGGSRNMLKLSNRESIMPVAIVTVVFFLWGFAYGLLDVLNGQFEVVTGLGSSKSLGLHAAYYGGYFLGPLTLGRFMLQKYGFRAAMIAGLCVYSCGTMVFWPAAVLTSYSAFIISNLIVGFGLSCLEIAANPFIALCGPLEYAEVRLNISQGFQGIGSVVSPLLAQKVFFKHVLDAPSLVNVQWTYLGIALFDVLLAIALYYVPLPEATDDDLEELADRRSAAYRRKVGPVPVIWLTLGLGVFSQFCYVGGQEANGNNTQSVAQVLRPTAHLAPFDYTTVGHTVFAVGRFISAFLNYILKPRWILLFLYVGLIISCALQMVLPGDAGMAMSMLIYTFESGVFSIIYAISMRGMGAHTKTASALMAAAISGGTLFSPIQTVVAQSRGVPYSYCVPLAAFAFGTIFAIYLNVVPAAKNQVDPVHERRVQRRNQRNASRAASNVVDTTNAGNQFGLSGILARRRREKHRSDVPSTQHVEQRAESSSSSSSIQQVGTSPTTDSERLDLQEPQRPSPARVVSRVEPLERDFARASPSRPEPARRMETLNEDHDLAPWSDDGGDDEDEEKWKQEILFGKSIASEL